MSSNGHAIGNRLRKLESIYTRPKTCQRCFDRPIRVAYIDPDTDTAWEENMPESGCPDCGTPICQELHIIVPDDTAGGETPA